MLMTRAATVQLTRADKV